MLFDTLYAPPPLAATATAVDEPPIPACRAWAARYVARPEAPVIDLTQGVPDTPPDPGLLRRLGEAGADRVLAGYGPLEGEVALRDAFAAEARSAARAVRRAQLARPCGPALLLLQGIRHSGTPARRSARS